MLLLKCVFVIGVLSLWRVKAHVSLTFPQARTYALDFLDNARTRGPCGYPPYPSKRPKINKKKHLYF